LLLSALSDSQLLAIFFVARWQSAGAPKRVRLVELGPGRGTLLCDMIRTFSAFPDMLSSLRSIELVELSPVMLEQQEANVAKTLHMLGKRLASADTPIEQLQPDEVRIEWFPAHDRLAIDPASWTMVVAHEFFDALPIHIFEKKLEGWREVLVDVDDGSKPGVTVIKASDIGKPPKEVGLRFVLSRTATPWTQLLVVNSERFRELHPGQRVEISPTSWGVARRLGELVSGYPALRPNKDGKMEKPTEAVAAQRAQPSLGGCGLIVDYGGDHWYSDSLRAFKQHRIVDPLADPGVADLTANVDFSLLRQAVATSDANTHGPMSQLDFLTAMGIQVRVQKLTSQNPTRKAAIEQAAARLVDATSMGKQYQMMALSAPAQAQAAEHEPEEVYPFLYERTA